MANIHELSKYRTLESIALDQTEDFFKPKTFLDLIFLLLLIFWWVTAVLFSHLVLFRAIIFIGILVLFFFTPIYVYFMEKEKTSASPMNRSVKILIFYIFISIFSLNSSIENLNGFPYIAFESTIVCILIPLTILWNSFSPRTLKISYWVYIQRIFQACYLAILVLYIFKGIYLLNPILLEAINFDLLIYIGFILFVVSSLFPVAPKHFSMSATDLFNQYQALKSRTERIRDTLLAGGFCLVVFTLLQWVNDSTLIELFQITAFFSILIGIILIFAFRNQKKDRFRSLIDNVSEKTQIIDPKSQIGNRVQNYAKTIQSAEFTKPERVYTIPNEKMKLISKGKTTISVDKGSIAVPTVTEKGTALVIMGKSELKTETENMETSSKKEIDGTTTIWLKPEEWDKIKLQLNPTEMSSLTEKELKNAGVDKATDIFENAKRALNDLKKWRGPQGIFSSVLDSTPAKYSIKETEDYSLVRLPGVYVFESNVLTLVNILGGFVKVIEIKGVGQYVDVFGGFVRVIETPDYTFVNAPVCSVIETPKGEKVRVLGIDINEGEEIDVNEIRSRIIDDQRNFDNLVRRKVETLFEEDPQLLFADSMGEKFGFIVGEDEILSDLPRKTKKESMKSKDRMRGRKKKKQKHLRSYRHKDKRRFRAQKQVSDESFSDVVTLDLDTEGYIKDNTQLNELDKALDRVDEAINTADEKFLNNEISEEKHTEMINRLKARKDNLFKKKEKLIEKSKIKLV